MSVNTSTVSSGPSLDLHLYSMFASKKKNSDVEQVAAEQFANMVPANFQISANIDEESRKDSQLNLTFVVTLNDSRGLVTYEFRGKCRIYGSSAEFSSLLEAEKSKVPKILDVLYQRLYPLVFMMSGATSAPYPQSVALASQMIAPPQSASVLTPEDRVVQAVKDSSGIESKKQQNAPATPASQIAAKKANDKNPPATVAKTGAAQQKIPPIAGASSEISEVPIANQPSKDKPKSAVASAE